MCHVTATPTSLVSIAYSGEGDDKSLDLRGEEIQVMRILVPTH